MIASKLAGHCDVISNRLWRHQQKENRASETSGRCVKIVIHGFVLSWRTISAPTRGFLCKVFQWQLSENHFTKDILPLVTNINFQVTCVKFHSDFPGANMLTYLHLVVHIWWIHQSEWEILLQAWCEIDIFATYVRSFFVYMICNQRTIIFQLYDWCNRDFTTLNKSTFDSSLYGLLL